MEQPAGLLDRYRDAYWYYKVWQAWLSLRPGEYAAWRKEHPEMSRAVNVIRKLRENDAD